ncbi:MAG: NAD(+)/NADH kinase [Armatimonadota bacterium]|nr:NAD(+)/NADH kinase [Armatimonadota bacterium]
MMPENPTDPPPVRSLGIVVNEEKPEAVRLGEELHAWLKARGVPAEVIHLRRETGADQEWRTLEGASSPPKRLFGDALVVLGGDGTLLATSRIAAASGQPMLSVHLGGFGFLTECAPEDVRQGTQRLLSGDYHVAERVMLQTIICGAQGGDRVYTALNDVVVAKGTLARLLHLRAFVDGSFVAAYAADGLIVSSPTGSTAYSLSAGGPLVHPDLEVFLLTPICSHGLNVRPLVLPATSEVKLTVENAADSEVVATMDGQMGVPLLPGEYLLVRRSPMRARLVQLGMTDFYRKLRDKLGWGERC